MKLILSLTFIWTLSSTAEALQCWRGEGVDIREHYLHPCNSTELCATVAAQALGGNITMRLCLPSLVVSEGKHTFSLNLGFATLTASLHACNTDGCNNQTIPYPDVQEKNGLQCFGCDDPHSTVCNQTVQCVGVEDRCFSMTAELRPGETLRTSGCVSANICEKLPHLELVSFLNFKFLHLPKCCEGSFCDSAWSVKLNVMTLLFGLIKLIFYYNKEKLTK